MWERLNRYRFATFVAGGLCVVAAAVIGWSLLGQKASVEPDPFAEFDVELGEATTSLSATTEPMLTVPPQNEPTGPSFDRISRPTAETEAPASLAVPAHFSSDALPVGESTTPVWLLGTIEPLEETTAPSVVPIQVRQAVGMERYRR
jgi:hypothetical protein